MEQSSARDPVRGRHRLALVTGAASGLGRSIADRLASDGHLVIVADIHGDDASRAVEEIEAAGGSAMPLALDVGDEESVASAYAAIDAHFGRLDILVNNAGISGERAPLEEMTLAAFDRTIRVNLTGTFLMSRGAIPLMRRHNWGSIVNMSSLTARGVPGRNRCNYTASKTGVIGFSRVLADEVGCDGITVNCVAPSRIMTALTIAMAGGNSEYFARGAAETVVGRLGDPSEVAHAVAWLCSDHARFVTGATLDVNGGNSMI
ncbi:SDR family oxidoreductase [Burkholderia diffusa]|uniref:SDR family oxidoreductase n=1 Tax=Burkholderia diffusa TaxID=488732 RepID=UPI00158C55B3|nr:SDR family NAD(P)-dependent oxidoreductase [Burkholderia diffusa]